MNIENIINTNVCDTVEISVDKNYTLAIWGKSFKHSKESVAEWISITGKFHYVYSKYCTLLSHDHNERSNNDLPYVENYIFFELDENLQPACVFINCILKSTKRETPNYVWAVNPLLQNLTRITNCECPALNF